MDDTKKVLEKLEKKIDTLDVHLDGIKVILAKQQVGLDHHIKRTDLLEKRVEQVSSDLKPVSTHVAVMGGIAKAIVILGTIVGMALAAKNLLGL
jgi:archaellum component FlaC